jgi:UDP-sugar transporter A1/2/3
MSQGANNQPGLYATPAFSATKGMVKHDVATKNTAAGGSLGSYHIKAVALVVLTLQNSSAPLLMRQSRSASSVVWIAQTGVIMQEVFKGLLSLSLICIGGEKISSVVTSRRELLRASVPALLYVLQNNLQYLAVTHLDAATYTVTYQLKILSTAMMSVLILKKRLDCEKWMGLVVLVLGVALVQISVAGPQVSPAGEIRHVSKQALGLVAVLSACMLSGLAGVYTEKILKGSNVSLWVRNAQLALCSLVIGFIGLLVSGDSERVHRDGFFVGYSVWTVASVVNNSFGGLLIAVVIKYADNILKNFSTAVSIILTTFVSANFMGLEASRSFICGVIAVCVSTFLYGGACRWQAVATWRVALAEAAKDATSHSFAFAFPLLFPTSAAAGEIGLKEDLGDHAK